MKSYAQLTASEKELAHRKAIGELLDAIIQGAIRFNDSLNEDDLQSRIDKAFVKAEAMRTPWFTAEFLMDDPVIKESVEGMAMCNAEDAFYSEINEHVVNGVIKEDC